MQLPIETRLGGILACSGIMEDGRDVQCPVSGQ